MSNINNEIHKLVDSIHELMRQSNWGWISWNQVARHQLGTSDGVDLLGSLAALPDYQHLFNTHRNKVKLSEAGLAFARSKPKHEKTYQESIADAVISYARHLKPIYLKIQRVVIVAQARNKYVHAVYVDLSDEVLPTETPVLINCAKSRSVTGKLVGQEPNGDVLYVACDTDIDESQEPTTLFIDRAYLLGQLAEQIGALTHFPERMKSLFEERSTTPIANRDSLIVAEDLAQLDAPWTQFLWGPPGSGKTFGLGHLVSQLLLKNPYETILIVAPSNRAVDVAVSHLRNRFAANSIESLIRKRKVLRFGYPRLPEVLEVPELLGPEKLDELCRTVNHISKQIAAAEQENSPETDSKVALLRANLLAAQEAVKDAVREHVAQCSVVATTSTLAYMPSSPIASYKWDTVIVDEVTMVPAAICTYLASRAKKRFLLAGDPCQLGPVYEDNSNTDSDSEYWLKHDIFTVGKVTNGKLSPDSIKLSDGRLARIASQRRCTSDIWNRISHIYPEVSNLSNEAKLQDLRSLKPASGFAIGFLDLSNQAAKCQKMKRSWQNVESARYALKIAITIAEQQSDGIRIAIICPYRAQVRLLRQWIRLEQRSETSLFSEATIEVGSIHQFQGSEADVVIFDMVDGPGRRNLGLLLRGDSGTRLVNVAISRAKGKFILVANRDWCRNADVPIHNELLSTLVFDGRRIKTICPGEVDSINLDHLESPEPASA